MLELSKIPKQVKHSKDVITWMKFFNGVRKEDFEDVAKEKEYVDKAYKILLNLSADEEKRMQYEAREDAIRDYNAIMDSMKLKI